jgi:tetratricopeptide (TPR) repeat protein
MDNPDDRPDYETKWQLAFKELQADQTDASYFKSCLDVLQEWAPALIQNDNAKLITLCNFLVEDLGDSKEQAVTLLAITLQTLDYSLVIPLFTRIGYSDWDSRKCYETAADFYQQHKDDFMKMIDTWQASIEVLLNGENIPGRNELAKQGACIGSLFLNELNNTQTCQTITELTLKLEPSNYFALYHMGSCYENQEDYIKALQFYCDSIKSAPDEGNKADSQFAVALMYDKMNQFYMAIDEYKKVLQLDAEYVFAFQNMSIIYEEIGDFRNSDEYWEKTLELYKNKYKNNLFGDDPDMYFYYADCIFYAEDRKTEIDFDLIEKLYGLYAEKSKSNDDIYYAFAKCYAEKRRAIRAGELTRDKESFSESDQRLNVVQSSLVYNFNRGIETLGKKLSGKSNVMADKFVLADLADLYLILNYFDEALNNFTQALTLDETFIRAREGIGVCLFKLKRYPESIMQFEKVLEAKPENLNIHSNLADAYRKAANLDIAEAIYLKLLDKVPLYVDASMGIGECFKSMGDQSSEKKDSDGALGYFNKAQGQFMKVLQGNGNAGTSRLLNSQEISGIRYSLGYTLVRLAESGASLDLSLLSSAKKEFKCVIQISSEYFKAQKAIKSINETIYSFSRVKEWVQYFIFGLSLLVFAGAQFVVISNYFSKRDIYKLNKDQVKSYLNKALPATQRTEMIKKMTGVFSVEFASIEDLQTRVDSLLPDSNSIASTAANLVTKSKVSAASGFDTTAYCLVTFGSLIFMIVGLFLPSITKLKVGSVEMDKNAVDTVKTSTSIVAISN